VVEGDSVYLEYHKSRGKAYVYARYRLQFPIFIDYSSTKNKAWPSDSMVRPLLKVADRDEMSMADNFETENG
jgi:hypothetical protein